MVTEDYVSFEIAKLLKEKGFDDECHAFYDKDGIFINLLQFVGNSNFKGVNEEKIMFAPTLQTAMKWLREVHNIHFFPDPTLTRDNRVVYGMYVLDTDLVGFLYEILEENTYEEACEAAIKYCLENLI